MGISMPDMEPFKNETESITLGQLTIENRLDQVEMYGSLSITRDQSGLALALKLKAAFMNPWLVVYSFSQLVPGISVYRRALHWAPVLTPLKVGSITIRTIPLKEL